MDYHSDRFVDASLMFYYNSELIAILPASLHNNELRSHGGLTYGGFICGDRMKQYIMIDCFNGLKEFCLCHGIYSILYKNIPYIYHKKPAQDDLYALFCSGAKLKSVSPTTVIDLLNPCKMAKGRKAQISRAQREKVEVKEFVNIKAFMELENKVLQEHHGVSAVHTYKELQLLHDRFPNNIICVGGFLNEKLIAGALLFRYQNVVHTQYLAADEKAREIGALDYVISYCLKKYESNVRYFDFGTSQNPNGGGMNTGLKAQKEGFGGRSVAQVQFIISLPEGDMNEQKRIIDGL